MLALATAHGIRSLAFPAISTGVYSYPLAEAATISLQTVSTYLQANTSIDLVRFVLFDQRAYQAFAAALAALSLPQ